jgi:hypothetical protein
MSNHDYRALCAELVAAFEIQLDELRFNNRLCIRARTALAQAEPQGPTDEEPTDQEIEEWADAAAEVPLEEMDPEVHGWRRCFKSDEFSETIRAALRRWGRPAIEPVPVSERLPGPEDCDEKGRCWYFFMDSVVGGCGWQMFNEEENELLAPSHFWLPHRALPVPGVEGKP